MKSKIKPTDCKVKLQNFNHRFYTKKQVEYCSQKFTLQSASLSLILLILSFTLLSKSSSAQVNFSGTTYTQDFQTMTNPGTTGSSIAGTTMYDISALYGGASGVSGWYVYGTAWTTAATKWNVTSGSSSTGSFLEMYDAATPVGRAFGSQGSGSAAGYFGVVLKNTSGATISSVNISFDAVMNRNPATTANAYPMSYRVSSTSVVSTSSTNDGTFNDLAGTWTSGTGFTTPSTGTGAPGTQGVINPLFRIGGTAITQTLTGLNWGADQYLYIRWKETDESGADATAGVDNFSISVPNTPVVTSESLSGNYGSTFSYNISATNSPSSFAVASGTLPAGLSLNTTTGAITGTPTDTITNASVTISSTNANGSGTSTLTFTIGKKQLTISSASGVNKTYDGNATATFIGTLNGIYNSDAVTLNASGTFSSSSAGNSKTITSTATLNGSKAGYYTLLQPTGLTANISQKELSISGITIQNKVYDGTTLATILGTAVLNGVLSIDQSNCSLGGTPSAVFSSAEISNNVNVIISGYSLSGSASGNYSLTQPTGLTANITAAALQPQTITFNSLTPVTYGDASFNLGASASSSLPVSYISSNTAVATVTGNTLTILSAGNTTITATQSGNSTYDAASSVDQVLTVNAKSLTVNGISINNKIYDGTTSATYSGGTITGVVGSDNVSLAGTLSFFDANVGNGKMINASLTLSGINAGNYQLVQPTGLTADINVKALTISGLTASNKVFDGNTSCTITGTPILVGVATVDISNVTLTGSAVGTFASSAIANNISVTVSGLSIIGSAISNYSLTMPALNANITEGPTTLTSGDIAIIGYNTSGAPDNFAILVMKNLTSGTTFFVNDNELASSSSTAFTDLAEGEASFTVKSGQNIPAGTVIVLPWGAAAVSTSTYDWSSTSSFGLGNNNDEIFIYTASSITATTPDQFIYYAKIGTSSSAVPSSLTTGSTSISPSGASLRYSTTSATYAACKPTLLSSIGNTAANWNTTGATAIAGSDWTFTVLAACPATVNLSVSSNSASEAAASVITVTVTASEAVTSDQTLTLDVSGTGITSGDYTLSNTIITIPAGSITGSVTFTIVDDNLIEGTETATLTISSPSNGLVLGSTTTQTISIGDNDFQCIATYSTTSVSNCGSYFWNGTTYTSSGVYTYNTINAGGCDSIATLNLTILNIPAQPSAFVTKNTFVYKGDVVTYTVANDINATSYTWSYSGTGASITGNSNSVSVSFNSQATNGIISVSANNSSCSSASRTLNVYVNDSITRNSNNLDYSFVTVGCNRVDYLDTAFSTGDIDYSAGKSTANVYQLKRLFNEVAHLNPLPKFLIMTGDVVMGYLTASTPDTTELAKQLRSWVEIYQSSPLASMPIQLVVVPGNHETQNKAAGKKSFLAAENIFTRIMSPYILGSNGPGVGGPDSLTTDQSKLTYSFDYHGDHFVMINTDPVGKDNQAPYKWISSDLQTARAGNARNIFAFSHKPAYSSSLTPAGGLDASSTIGPRDSLWKYFETYGCAAMFSAHEHLWDTINPHKGKTWQVIAGNGGTRVEPIWVGSNKQYYGYTIVNVFNDRKINVMGVGRNTTQATTAGASPYPVNEDYNISTVRSNFNICLTTYSTTSVSNCGSYLWNGTTYTSSGVYTYTTINAGGCDSIATLNLYIGDTIVPTITAPTNLTVNTNNSCVAQGLSLGIPTTSDNCSVSSVTNNAPVSFPVGSTTVTWTVKDNYGNSATATQIVTVRDSVKPTIYLNASVVNTLGLKGSTSSQTPYIQSLKAGVYFKSLMSVPDTINGYSMSGIPDGLGAFDNGDGTFSLLMNHEIGNTLGVTRAHGNKGSFVSNWVIRKSDLAVLSGSDLMTSVYAWNATTQSNYTTPMTPFAFNRFCSADLSPVSAYYNALTGKGTTERIFMHGEEGGATGYQLATVATGVNKGKSYILGKFNSSTNGNLSGLTGVGAWENALACPYEQDKTIVIGNNDGGTTSTAMNNSVAVYIGTKQSTGTEIEKAGLTNGKLRFVKVSGVSAEIANTTTRASNIVTGASFSLDSAAATTFSRPEDGAWDPMNPGKYYFVTTDQLDQVSDGIGTQVGRSRLWRLNFTDITNPELGGTIDMLLDGTEGQVMFDNIGFDKLGHIICLEDVGNADHNGKIWQYTIATDQLELIGKHDISRFGNVSSGVVTSATSPFNKDEETSGVIDMSDILGAGHYLIVDQAHYTTGMPASAVEGGQLLAMFVPASVSNTASTANDTVRVNATGCNTVVALGTPATGDNCSVASVTNNAPATFPIGTTNVLWTVTDASGNTNTATQVVIVTDTTTPVVTTASACGSYVWSANGQTYNASGTYTTQVDCRSRTLNLTINISTTSSRDVAACNSFNWNGTNYTTSGVYTYTTQNAKGCDSVAILNLTINTSTTSSRDVAACNSFNWNGTNYTTSGVYTFTTQNAKGCDSVATLNLTINRTTYSTETVSACSSYVWQNVTYTASNNTATWTTTNSVGCDSVVTLNLTISRLTPAAPASLTQTLISNVCGQRVYRYTLNTVTNALGYSWLLPQSVGGISGVTLDSGDVNSSRIIRVKYSSNTAALASDSIKARAYSGCDNSPYKSFKLTNTVLNVPAAPTVTVTAVDAYACGARKYRYTASALTSSSATVTAATGWLWTLADGAVGSTGTIDSGSVYSQVIVVSYSSNEAAVSGDSIKVRFTSDCGLGAVKATKLTNTALGVPAAPTVTVTAVDAYACGARKYRYSASGLTAASTTVGAATGWMWTLADGTVGSTGTIDSGSVNSQVIVVSYTSNAAAVAGDSIRVRFTSGCGLGAVKATKLTNTALAVPAAPTVTVTALDANACGARKYRYSASALTAASTTVGAATGWLWTLADGAVGSTGTIDSGSVNSQVIVVSYTSNAAAVAGDSIRVRFTSGCGLGAVKATKLTNTALGVPAAPTVTVTAVDANTCGARKYRYSASALPAASTTVGAATGWLWTLADGAVGSTGTIDSGSVNSQVIVVSYTSNAAAVTGDSIRVRFTSGCGLGAVKATKLSNTALSAPAAPASVTITLVSDKCGERVYRYAAPVFSAATTTVGAATGYLWSLPFGNVGSTGILDSANLTSRVIRIKYSSNAAAATGDSIKVMYTSACGNSPWKAQKLSNVATTILGAPTTLTGTTSICSIVGTSSAATYTCSAVTNAVSYVWSIPAGAVIDSGSNGLKIKVRFITAGTADSIYVQAVGTNGCYGTKKVLKLVTTGCVTPTYSRVENHNNAIDPMTVSVYPNPTTSNYHLFVKSNSTSTVNARVFDAQGRLVKTFKFNSIETVSFGNDLKSGVYFVELRGGKELKTVRVVKY